MHLNFTVLLSNLQDVITAPWIYGYIVIRSYNLFDGLVLIVSHRPVCSNITIV